MQGFTGSARRGRPEWYEKNVNFSAAVLFIPLFSFISCTATEDIPTLTGKLLEEYAAAKNDYLAGAFDKAEAAFRRITSSRADFFQARFMLGKTLFARGRTAEAEDVFSELVRRYPAYHEAALWAARSEAANGKSDAAQKRLRRLLAFDSSDPRLLALYARSCAERNDAASALQYYHLSSQYEDELAANRFETARYYFQFGMYDKALKEIDRCLLLLSEGSGMKEAVAELKNEIMKKNGGKK